MAMPGKRFGLVAARKAAGLSQECLAERMGVERSTVQRWETGQCTPQPCHRPKLARVLGISDDKLAELLADHSCSDDQFQTTPALVTVPRCGDAGSGQQTGESDLLAFPPGGDRTDRRQALTLLGTSTLGLGAPHADLDPSTQSAVEAMEFTRRAEVSQLGPRTLEHLDCVVSDLAATVNHTPPGELFPKARWYRRQVEDLLAGQYTLREGRELYRHASSLGVILAWLSIDLGDLAAAEAHCLDAWEHGWQAEDHAICAWSMCAKTTIATYNNRPVAARDAAECGLKHAPPGSAAAAGVSVKLARAYARLGQADQFQDVLKDTQIRFNQLSHPGSGLFSASSGMLASYMADSYVWLGQPYRAIPYAEETISFCRDRGLSEREPTREALARLNLAQAHVDLGQPDDAAEHIAQALSSERITGVVLRRLGDLTVFMQHKYPQLGITKELADRHREMTASLSQG
ncbi:MAG: helix-turn-helix transcriptional regulator [Pseudonocardiales bacterium]|nr:helix-turn-helix transcriptional regulator [Pseudonocardiales bacterium]